VFLFAAAASVFTTVLFGLAPALIASRADLNSELKAAGSKGAAAGRTRGRQSLIAIEVALSLALVSGAGLMIRSLREIVSTGIGFETARLATADIDLPQKRYPDDATRSRFFRELIARARSAPGVQDAAVVDNLPLHQVAVNNFYIAGRPDPPIDSLPMADIAHVSPEYFRVTGLRLHAGRMFTSADLALNERNGDGVAIVNQAFTRQFLSGENPLGQHLLSQNRKHASEIIGVIADYTPMGVENGTRPQIFWPNLQLSSATLVVRASVAPASLTKTIENTIWSLDKGVTANKVQPMDSYVDEWQSQRKFNTLLLGIFAALALVLALIGIYGVLSNMVASRVREIGIRMAIGALPAEIGKLILLQSMIPVLAGLVLGLAGSLALSRFLKSLLFHIAPRDPLTLAFACGAILLLSPAAIAVPLVRATRVDCTVALREE
jgi:putative ABC transport system permease protein